MFLITGLGNPGSQYQRTRHNVGFMLVDLIARQRGRRFRRTPPRSLTCSIQIGGERVVLAKPLTFMNLSGQAVRELLTFYSVDLRQLVVVYDDAALPLGKIRIRRAGSSGGQKGVQSIIEALGTEGFPRLRIGVGPQTAPQDLSSFVLSEFEELELEILDQVLERASQAVSTLVAEGSDRAMALFN